MSCQNCYTGCSEITSDRCVRYTGIDIPSLGIEAGDSLSVITEALTNFLLTVIPGTAIKPVISESIICELVAGYLPVCGELTIVDFVIALIKSVCDLQTQVTTNTDAITALNADYDVDCLTGVTVSTDTHDILQAVIAKLCLLDTDLTALTNYLAAYYSANGAELDAYIANYLVVNSPTSTLMSNKMVPYVAYEFYGSLSGKFDAYGVGLPSTDWEDIYICNGANGTPDKRGRVAIGATDSPSPVANPLDAYVDPAIAGNPTYAGTPGAWTKYGANLVTLNSTHVPNHTHTATATATQASHYHFAIASNSSGDTGTIITSTTYVTSGKQWGGTTSYELAGNTNIASLGKTDTATPIITVDSVTVASTAGGGYGHPNVQPGIATYYIMWIP
jgi:microcystin-dependent protein